MFVISQSTGSTGFKLGTDMKTSLLTTYVCGFKFSQLITTLLLGDQLTCGVFHVSVKLL